jgi:thiamine biosynthesis lipoprotein
VTRPPLRFVEHVAAAMDTAVSIQIAEATASSVSDAALLSRARHAFRWFDEVEATCSRFDPASELARLSRTASAWPSFIPVRPLLFELLQLAIAVAAATDGAFDPTLGAALQAHGFDRHWRTGERLPPGAAEARDGGTWRDLVLDPDRRAVAFRCPLTLDLGGIAKGFAIDLAARDLADLPHLTINAGGDLYARGQSPLGSPWRIGIRDPLNTGCLAARVTVSNVAVCTSGTDQRRRADGGHHLLDPRTGRSAQSAASVTVLAPLTALADALATAAFVLGPGAGLALLDREHAQGLCIDAAGARHTTACSSHGTWEWITDDAALLPYQVAPHVSP